MIRFGAIAAAISIACAGASAAASAAGSGITAIQSFDGNGGWLNGAALGPSDLAGKVVLVDVFEYTCVNCLRTLPYLKAWYARYKDDGFVIVGVHTPEFDFSGDKANVAAAVKRLGIQWPVVLDPDGAIFKRYGAGGWPTEYVFDQRGALKAEHDGEGGYPQTEATIQSLLRAANPGVKLPAVMALLPQDSYDKPGALCYPQTAETFVGPWHGQSIADAPVGRDPSGALIFSDPGGTHADGAIYLQGYWNEAPHGEGMIAAATGDALSLTYHAIQVVVVMKPENGSVRVDVTEDGKPVPRADAGSDLAYDASGNSYVQVDAPRAYDVVMNAHFGSHALKMAPERYGAGFYDFAFESCEVPKGS